MWCGVVWYGVVWCGVVWCVVRCAVVWCGVVWCGVVWCGVAWCGLVYGLRRVWPLEMWICTREIEEEVDGSILTGIAPVHTNGGFVVSSTLTTYNFGSFVRSGKDYDQTLIIENARFVTKGHINDCVAPECAEVKRQIDQETVPWAATLCLSKDGPGCPPLNTIQMCMWGLRIAALTLPLKSSVRRASRRKAFSLHNKCASTSHGS